MHIENDEIKYALFTDII